MRDLMKNISILSQLNALAFSIFSLLLFTICLNNVYATTIRVPQDYPSFSFAIRAAQDNQLIDIIIVDSQFIISEHDVVISDIEQSLLVTGSDQFNFTDFIANFEGRHLLFDNNEGTITINYMNFSGGVVTGTQNHGGSLKVLRSPLILENCLFTTNVSEGGGGAIYVENSMNSTDPVTINLCSFDHNSCDTSGGGILVSGSNLVNISNSRFDNNLANDGGGLFCNLEAYGVTLNGVTFEENQAINGGALFTRYPIQGSSCTFTNNWAEYGMAIYAHAVSALAVTAISTFSNCYFDHHDGGRSVIRCVDLNEAFPSYDMYFDNCKFKYNYCLSRTILSAHSSNVTFNNCIISDNACFKGNIIYAEGNQSTSSSEVIITNTQITNNVCNNDYEENNGILRCGAYGEFNIESSTISCNSSFHSSDDYSVIFTSSPNTPKINVNNTNISFNTGMKSIIVEFGIDELSFCYTDIYDNSEGDWIPPIQNMQSVCGNKHIDPSFVDSELRDYRLKWSSPLNDSGDPGLPVNFDLTCADIGWTPIYSETEISGTVTLSNRGWYKVIGTTTISGIDTVIPEGTTIRMDEATNLFIRDTNSVNGYNITVGDPDGARTAIVGTPTGGNIVFGTTTTAPTLASTRFDGVMFNRAASFLLGSLWFNYCNMDMNGANGNVKFANYNNTEMVFDEICQGQFRNFDFTAQQVLGEVPGIGCIDVQYSDVDILNIVFDRVNLDPIPWYWKVLHYGTIPGNPTHIIAGCSIDALDNTYEIAPMILYGTNINLHHNLFSDIQVGAISMGSTTLKMRNGAANTFDKPINANYDAFTIIEGNQSMTDLHCGYNSFIDRRLETGDLFINSGCASADWSYNFWGDGCENGISPAGHIPTCVTDYTPWMTACPTQFVPCVGQDDENELYTLGLEANSLFNYPAAVAYWFQLLMDFPDYKGCTEVTSSFKAIGLFTDYGAASYSLIRGNLELAAVESELVDELLSVYQVCSAWCVEGRHGDRVGAVALLDSLHAAKQGNVKAQALVSTALAEIAQYPPQGQNNAMGPDAQVAQLIRRQEGLRELYRTLVPALAAIPVAPPVKRNAEVPAQFGIRSCYPNPFNPVTTIEVEVVAGDPLQLEVYNVKGQLVQIIHQGSLTGGKHQFHWLAEAQSSGLYFVRAQQGTQSSIAKVMLVR